MYSYQPFGGYTLQNVQFGHGFQPPFNQVIMPSAVSASHHGSSHHSPHTGHSVSPLSEKPETSLNISAQASPRPSLKVPRSDIPSPPSPSDDEQLSDDEPIKHYSQVLHLNADAKEYIHLLSRRHAKELKRVTNLMKKFEREVIEVRSKMFEACTLCEKQSARVMALERIEGERKIEEAKLKEKLDQKDRQVIEMYTREREREEERLQLRRESAKVRQAARDREAEWESLRLQLHNQVKAELVVLDKERQRIGVDLHQMLQKEREKVAFEYEEKLEVEKEKLTRNLRSRAVELEKRTESRVHAEYKNQAKVHRQREVENAKNAESLRIKIREKTQETKMIQQRLQDVMRKSEIQGRREQDSVRQEQARLAQLDADIEKARQELEEAEKSSEFLIEQVNSLKSQLQLERFEKEQSDKALLEEIEDLKGRCKTSTTEVTQLRKQLQDIDTQKGSVCNQLKASEKSCEEANRAGNALHQEVRELREQLSHATATMAENERMYSASMDQEKLGAAQVKKALSVLQEDLTRALHSNASLQSEVQRLNLMLPDSSQKSTLDKETAKVSTLTAALDAERARRVEMEASNRHLRAETTNLEEELRRARATSVEIGLWQSRAQNAEEELRRLRVQCDGQAHEFQKLKDAYALITSEVERLRRSLQDKEREILSFKTSREANVTFSAPVSSEFSNPSPPISSLQPPTQQLQNAAFGPPLPPQQKRFSQSFDDLYCPIGTLYREIVPGPATPASPLSASPKSGQPKSALKKRSPTHSPARKPLIGPMPAMDH